MARYNLILKDAIYLELLKKAQKNGMTLGKYLNMILTKEVEKDIEIEIEDEGKKGRGLVWKCYFCGVKVVAEENTCYNCGAIIDKNKIKEAVGKFRDERKVR